MPFQNESLTKLAFSTVYFELKNARMRTNSRLSTANTTVSKGSKNGTRSTTPNYLQTSTTSSNIKVSTPWRLEYKYDEENISFPKKLLFKDYCCKKPLDVLDLRGWTLSSAVFEIIYQECANVRALLLDDTQGLDLQCFESIRGLKQLRNLSLQRIVNCPITPEIAQVFASFKLLKYLNLNECQCSTAVFQTISMTCANLKSLSLSKCAGLDDFGLHALGQMIQRFRVLQKVDLSGCADFGDDGLLDFFVAGFNFLSEVNLNNCRCVGTSALAGLRTKMPEIKTLSLSNMNMGNTIFEWLSEGCRSLTSLDISSSAELDDAGLARIGRWCRHLVHINASKCLLLTDHGVSGFFKQFYGFLEEVDFSNCIQLGSGTAHTLSRYATRLQVIKLNGLSKVDATSLTALWSAARCLRHFEMCSNLSTTTTHRKSSMPHFSDFVLTNAILPVETLTQVKFIGAFQITDVGACALARACVRLHNIDVSYCNSIGDAFLMELAVHAVHLKSFIGTGCILITSEGVKALSTGVCCQSLEQLEVNGCAKVMDEGLIAIGQSLPNLHTLGIRACEHATDLAITHIAEGCTKLRSIDITNLDFVSVQSVQELTNHCPYLTSLTCEGCNFTPGEFAAAVKKALPFARHMGGSKCKLVDFPRALVRYNKYVMEVQHHERYVRVLQKFARFILSTFLFRLAKRLRREQRALMQRVFVAFRAGTIISRKEGIQVKRHYGAVDLQRGMRRMYAIHLARVKARLLRKQKHARLLLQRVFRGFASRKRTTATFTKLYYFYNLIGHLAHKYRVLRAARQTHRYILCAQGFARMVPRRVNYRVLLHGITCLQLRWRYYSFKHSKRLVKEAEARERQRLDAIRRDQAARCMQRNWKHSFFNKSMAPFILTCCIYFRIDYDEKKWNSTIMQRYWRGYIVRLKNYRRTEAFNKTYQAACKIQSILRMRLCRKHFFPLRRFMKRLNQRYRVLLLFSRPRLRLGLVVKVLQKYARRFVFVMRRYYASIHLQRVYRGYYYRQKWLLLVYQLHTDKVNKIKRVWYLYTLRKKRKAELHRRHMAAYKIWAMVDKLFQPKRRAVAISLEKQAAWDAQNQDKQNMLHNKRVKTVNRIRDRYHNVLAARIQHAYRKHKQRKLEKTRSLTKIRRASNLAKAIAASNPSRPSAAATLMAAPSRMAKKIIGAFHSPFGPTEDIPEKDTAKLVNSVLKYQVKNILQVGLEELHLTVGEMERKNFQNTQNSFKRGHLPHFVQLEEDLSGDLNLLIFLWTKYGSGKGCICHIEVVAKPPNMSLAGMKIRANNLMQTGVKLAWNHHVHFEVHGICSVLQGKGDFAIQDVKIAQNPEEVEALEAAGHFFLASNLAPLGMHTSIWTTARKLDAEDNLYRFAGLASHEWFDDRLLRICKGFNLTEENVLTMYGVFKEVQAGRRGDKVRLTDLFLRINYPYNQIAQWVFAAIQPEGKSDIIFSEMVHMVAFFVMLAQKELMKFLFHAVDTDNKQYLREDQFHQLIDVLGEDSPFNPKGWHLLYKQYYDKKLNYFFIGSFERLIHFNPGVLWQAQALQRKMMEACLGVSYWERKMEQFRLIRADLGIKLL